jgi:hypothetical protein
MSKKAANGLFIGFSMSYIGFSTMACSNGVQRLRFRAGWPAL